MIHRGGVDDAEAASVKVKNVRTLRLYREMLYSMRCVIAAPITGGKTAWRPLGFSCLRDI
jgi:hypothetical protein